MSALNTEQRTQVARWVAEGSTLSQVQERLRSEFGLSMTYMDVRFLVDDLDLTLVDKPEPKPVEPVVPGGAVAEGAAVPVADQAAVPPNPPGLSGKVKLEVDPIAQPGYMVNGRVTFSDGQVAMWAVDVEGRPRMSASTPGYRPTPADMEEFQVLLENEFRKLGY